VESAYAVEQNGKIGNSKALEVQIVLATRREEDREILAGLLAGSAWRLIEANTPQEALAALRHVEIPIMLCDPLIGGGRWKTMLRSFLSARRGASVVLLLDRFRGLGFAPMAPSPEFDFLIRPLDREQVFAALFFAYGRCKAAWSAAWLARSRSRRI
jgi:DNA-binding NtrC family response regulator